MHFDTQNIFSFYFSKMRTRGYNQVGEHFGGDAVESFASYLTWMSKNSGRRHFRMGLNSAFDKDIPFGNDVMTHLRITSKEDMTQLGKTFINMKFTGIAHLTKDYTTTDEEYKDTNKIAICFKNAAEVIRQIEIDNNGVDSGYLQQYATIESFAYHTYDPRSQKNNRKFTHSLYSNVQKFDNSICGTYLNLSDFVGSAGNYQQPFEINCVIPVSDLLGLQYFEDWPSFLGDIVMKFYISERGLVYTQLDPQKTSNKLNTISDGNVGGDPGVLEGFNPYYYSRKFAQIGTKSSLIRVITSAGVPTYTIDTLSVTDFQCVECYCNTYGYGLSPSILGQLRNMISPEHPLKIPAQEIFPKNFGNSNEGGINSDFSTVLHNVSDVILVFPKSPTALTCYENPMMKNLQLNIDNKLYPEKPFSTIGGRFFQSMINASDLDSVLECTDEYEDSLTRSLNQDDGSRNYNSYKDITSFLCTIQTERNATGIFFDGLESGNSNVKVALHCDPIWSGEDSEGFKRDTYFFCDVNLYDFDDTVHPPPAQAWFCRKTFWQVDPVNSLRYIKNAVPPELQSEADILISRNI
jgi:hypothetical protein